MWAWLSVHLALFCGDLGRTLVLLEVLCGQLYSKMRERHILELIRERLRDTEDQRDKD